MNNKLVRTTISLPDELLYEIKKRALENRKTITETMSEGLSFYLKIYSNYNIATEHDDISTLFGSWGKGQTGKSIVKKLRSGKKETSRDNSLQKLWKKS
jgi:hypothetical protein